MDTLQAPWRQVLEIDEIGPYIKELRIAAGRSQTDVATAVGISRPYYTRVERNQANVSPEIYLAILQELGSPGRFVIETPFP